MQAHYRVNILNKKRKLFKSHSTIHNVKFALERWKWHQMVTSRKKKKKMSLTVVFIHPPQAKHEAGEVQEGGERGAAAGWGE